MTIEAKPLCAKGFYRYLRHKCRFEGYATGRYEIRAGQVYESCLSFAFFKSVWTTKDGSMKKQKTL